MKKILFAVPLALAAATPAHATGGFQCTPVGGRGPILSMGIPHAVAARPFFVVIQEGQRILSTGGDPNLPQGDPLVLGQSWVDSRYLWLDLLDAEADHFEAKLRARFGSGRGASIATGTLERGGKTYQVRCIEN